MNARPDHKSIAELNALDAAWGEIDALGGTVDKTSPYDIGYDAALGDALLVIEELGGMNPLLRQQHAPPTVPADAYAGAPDGDTKRELGLSTW